MEKVAASLPPDMQLPIASTIMEVMETEDVLEEVADQDEEAEMPPLPEVEEVEAAAEEQAGEEEAGELVEEVGDSGGMIGQLPTENEVTNGTSSKDYTTIKKQAWDKVNSLLGDEVVVKTKKNGSMTWKVI